MTRSFAVLLILTTFAFAPLAQAQNSGNHIFDNSFVHEVYFEFTQANYWQQLTQNFETSQVGQVPYIMGKVTIDGEVVDSVGVRFKGFTSYPFESDKKPIKIDFNEFVPGKRYDGLRKINFNNGTGDPGMQRDVVCYDLMRSMGVNAPRTSFSKVFFNGEYLGLYQTIEQVDKEFLQNNFSNPDGNLFKNMGWSHFEWLGNSVPAYDEIFDLKTNKDTPDWSGFINLMDVLNNTTDSEFLNQIEDVFNVNLFLRTLAVDVATNNWDSYLQHGRNWYIYEDVSTGQFHWIPWDYNFSLDGGFSFGGGDDCFIFPDFFTVQDGSTTVEFKDFSFIQGNVDYLWEFGDGQTSMEMEPTHTYANAGEYEVCLTLTESADCSNTYCEFIDTEFSLGDCNSIINGSCPHEPGENFALTISFMPECCDQWTLECEDFYQQFSGSENGSFAIDQRENTGVLINRLLAVPDFYDRYTAFFCELVKEHFVPDKIGSLIDHNAALIDTDVFNDPNFLFDYESFLSDVSEDGLKSIIASRTDELLLDLATITDCDFDYEIIAAGDLVINELMASNDSTSTIVDEAGEQDDWIELFNTSSNDLDLSGVYLSDDPGNLTKWQFPLNQMLEANEYLIVWADNDTNQPGLHANFKLNKEGDVIYLSNADSTLIDSINFDLQVTNLALARNPNGTGDFVQQQPTFGYNNEEPSSASQPGNAFPIKIFPVPAGDVVQVSIADKVGGNHKIDIYTSTGQLVAKNIFANDGQTQIDLSSFANGFYFMKVSNEKGESSTSRFVKGR